jgi:hypothetical protein
LSHLILHPLLEKMIYANGERNWVKGLWLGRIHLLLTSSKKIIKDKSKHTADELKKAGVRSEEIHWNVFTRNKYLIPDLKNPGMHCIFVTNKGKCKEVMLAESNVRSTWSS